MSYLVFAQHKKRQNTMRYAATVEANNVLRFLTAVSVHAVRLSVSVKRCFRKTRLVRVYGGEMGWRTPSTNR